MDLREQRRGPSKLEYVLISVLALVLVWAAWIMLKPVVWPVIEDFVQTAFEEVAATPTPTPEPELSSARFSRHLIVSQSRSRQLVRNPSDANPLATSRQAWIALGGPAIPAVAMV